MQNESTKDDMADNVAASVLNGAAPERVALSLEDGQSQEIADDNNKPIDGESGDGDHTQGKEPPEDARGDQQENRVQQHLNQSPAAIVTAMSGNHNTAYSTYVSYHHTLPTDSQQSLDVFIAIAQLESSQRSYKSVSSKIVDYSGVLLAQRIILLSCHDEDIALNIAKSIAYETKIVSKELVTIDRNAHGNYNFRNLIDCLARPKEKRATSLATPTTICVWAANDIKEDEIPHAILESLLSASARIDQYKTNLTNHGICLICLVPPHKIQERKNSRLTVALQKCEIDFLLPLLEEYEFVEYEKLAETILQQRKKGQWSEDNAEFYKEVIRHLLAGSLPEIVANRPPPGQDDVYLQELFNRQDPVVDTVLYCATYYPDLSPQDFSYLVELFLGNATEEVTRRIEKPDSQNGNEVVSVVESVPLLRRWRREADAILRRCKLASLRNENDQRVIDFQEDGLRKRLSQYIRNEHYFFYESNFVLLRWQGLLFSPRKVVAEGARRMFVQMAAQYAPDEVANWLYEIVAEFEDVAQTAELLKEQSPLFHLLPDVRVKAARRYVCHGLSLVLNRLDKEPELRDAARLFWQRLLRAQHQWFLDLLRRMGNSAPAESSKWLRQLLDQGAEEIRQQVRSYLVAYLLHRDSLIYPTLKELMQWPKTTQAGRIAQEVLIIYCADTNRRVAQPDYGQWPSSHPLFGFQNRGEAEECIDLLVNWLSGAADEVDSDNALYMIADVVAGWYFILPSPSLPEFPEATTEAGGETDLDARIVHQLLLKSLAQHLSRAQKNSLPAIWENLKNDILEEVFRLEAFANLAVGTSLNAELMNDTASARRKLLDTWALLNQLRMDFIRCAVDVIPS